MNTTIATFVCGRRSLSITHQPMTYRQHLTPCKDCCLYLPRRQSFIVASHRVSIVGATNPIVYQNRSSGRTCHFPIWNDRQSGVECFRPDLHTRVCQEAASGRDAVGGRGGNLAILFVQARSLPIWKLILVHGCARERRVFATNQEIPRCPCDSRLIQALPISLIDLARPHTITH